MLPPYDPAANLPAPPALLFLRVTDRGRVYLPRPLLAHLQLRPGQPIDLLPPGHSPYWHLDLRPAAANRLAWYADTRARIQRVYLPAGLVRTGELLTLRLLPGEPAYPSLYPLLPPSFFQAATGAAATAPG